MNPESYPGTTESAYMRARMERGMEGGGFVCGNFMPPQESLVGWLAVPLLLVKTAAWAATHSHLRGWGKIFLSGRANAVGHKSSQDEEEEKWSTVTDC